MPETTPAKTNRKSYAQHCPVATALDVAGDRWTLLILRELLGGSARFHELSEGLPGIATNLLTDRLRRLEEDGVVRRTQMHGTVLYALTEHGAGIRTALEELGFWGARLRRVAPPVHERSVRAIAMALQAVLVRAGDALPHERTVVELEVEGEPIEIVLDRRPTVAARPATDPDARMHATAEGMAGYLMGRPVDGPTFTHASGREAATRHLLVALGCATDG